MTDTPRRRFSQLCRSTILAVAVGINLLLSFITIFSAYGGLFSPEERVIASIALMFLPSLLIAGGVMMVIDLLIDRRLILIILGGWLISAGPILNFAPINLFRSAPIPGEDSRSFSLLTYNIMHFIDFRDPDIKLPANTTLSHILTADADIVALQECEEIWQPGFRNVSRSQLDSLRAQYPYRIIGSDYELSLLSKYPCEEVEIKLPRSISYVMACYRIAIGADTLHLLNVHLKSIGLTPQDKELFKESLNNIPDSRSELREEIREVKSQLLTKLSAAFKDRAAQARGARQVIDSIGGPFIVAGDFNDIPDSYAARIIRGDDMTDLYARVATGPCVTYHADRFYFRIDQIFYRGPFEAVSLIKGNAPSSDHSSLEAEFVFNPPASP